MLNYKTITTKCMFVFEQGEFAENVCQITKVLIKRQNAISDFKSEKHHRFDIAYT